MNAITVKTITMNALMKPRALTLFVSLLLSSVAFQASAATLEVVEPWARPSPPGAPSAGFMRIKNLSDQDDVLLSASGDFASRIELHLSSMVDGVMKMAEQEQGVVIPAGGEVVFKPGSYHLMFMGLYQPFNSGEAYQVTLEFKQAGMMTVVLPVKTIDEAAKTQMHH
ncbi:copper chaperone PCu(A)C [Reinekea thalattae]|uniref:Copper chaperone PCu(A)C n=1 Tax=Reinekea thalattae TaxID=2593301 RepID=A0A5C8ZD63_9GAMM|nr:copper chaperone PCu(A)C [Reinekea thalattae]TXR54800.1 copper chaperone PCu(A)C [Reinekea thalattae]